MDQRTYATLGNRIDKQALRLAYEQYLAADEAADPKTRVRYSTEAARLMDKVDEEWTWAYGDSRDAFCEGFLVGRLYEAQQVASPSEPSDSTHEPATVTKPL